MRVLVVEDERRIATGLKRGLEADGFSVDLAFTGDDGIWYATEATYDVIVLDLMLPGRNGFEICRQLRETGDWTPILILTAKEGTLDESEALDTGADDYLRKPFSYPVLVSRIRALMRRAGGRVIPDTTLTIGDLVLDPIAQRAWRDSVELELSPKAFMVLQILMRREGELITTQNLLDTAWGYDFEGDPNVVQAYISRLRRAIDRPFNVDSIKTIRGVGYRLVPVTVRDMS
jgi:DNA-binding response OmpR family regulator